MLRWEDCATIHDEWLLTEEEQVLAKRVRGLLKQENGMKTLLSMMEKADTSEALSAALDEAEKAE